MPAHSFGVAQVMDLPAVDTEDKTKLFREKENDNSAGRMHAHHVDWPAARGLFNLLMKA